ncbi:PIG-L deacetylase family protein [Sphaerisporangium aureirubrum]|uniref:PIG-L deacetylase family protein n=1 Tax=Sphaerisporangium aureirubrum TaxID=1544736 RepID=A0ABW1NIF4_9ACTN
MRGEPGHGPVLVFAPHPDDEVIACGGVVARLAAAGVPVTIVFATDGSRSHSAVLGIEADPSPAELAVIRRGEAKAAAKALGLGPGDVVWLGHTDTLLSETMPRFRAEVTALLRDRADVAEVYLPHEVRELNADHRLTGEAVADALADLGLTPRLRRYVVWDEDTEAAFAFTNRVAPDRPAPEGERPARTDVSAWLERKRAALEEHRTQVTLFSPAQDRPVVPEEFARRVLARRAEEFWIVPRDMTPGFRYAPEAAGAPEGNRR